jgi:hypothetical protein
MPDHTILATVTVACDDDAASIELQETLLKNHAPFHQARHVSSETDRGGRYIQAGCQAGTYSQPTVAHITSEDGYTPQAMAADPSALCRLNAVRLSPAGRDSPAAGHLPVTG